jgi:hypothetical protein
VCSAWASYYRERKKLMAEQLSKMEKANAFYMKQLLLKTHGHWLKWTKDVCARKQSTNQMITHTHIIFNKPYCCPYV